MPRSLFYLPRSNWAFSDRAWAALHATGEIASRWRFALVITGFRLYAQRRLYAAIGRVSAGRKSGYDPASDRKMPPGANSAPLEPQRDRWP